MGGTRIILVVCHINNPGIPNPKPSPKSTFLEKELDFESIFNVDPAENQIQKSKTRNLKKSITTFFVCVVSCRFYGNDELQVHVYAVQHTVEDVHHAFRCVPYNSQYTKSAPLYALVA